MPQETTESDPIKLTKDEIEKLKGRVEAWSSMNRQEQKRERADLVTDFITCCGDNPDDEWKRGTLRTKVTQWFGNNAAPSQSRLPGLLKTAWTARQVFNERMSEKIARKQAKLLKKATESGESMRDIVALNKARMMVWNKLSNRKKDAFKEEAARWTKEGPDPLSKLEVIEKRVPAWVDAFACLLHDQANIMAQITFCHVDAQGRVVETFYDISDSWHRQEKKTLQYTKVYPNWQRSFPDSFVRFCRRVLLPDEEFEDDEAIIPKPRTKAEPADLDVYPEGDPILPPLSYVKTHELSRQATIRRFFNAHYALACGVAGVPVPWNTLAGKNDEFLTPHSLVANRVIQDPSRMTKTVIEDVWDHIIELQDHDDPARRFRFAQWYDSDTEKFFDAKYDTQLAEKKPPGATRKHHKGGPPASNPWHLDRVHAGDGATGNRVAAAAASPAVAAGGGARTTTGRGGTRRPPPGPHRQSSGAKGPNTKDTRPGRSLKGKGKAPAKDASDTAESSSEEEDSDVDPRLDSDGSGDDFNFDKAGGFGGNGLSNLDDVPSAGPSRSHAPTWGSKPFAGPGGLVPPTSSIAAPAVDPLNPWEIDAAPSLPPKPDSVLVNAAKKQSPSWVGHIAERLFPFLWALAGEGPYRALLTGWRHMLTRRALFKEFPIGDWANWNYEDVALPPVIHRDEETWDRFLTWLEDAAPKDNASASEVQRWFLVLGMAIRDIHIKNSTEDDEEVPAGWPEYMRSSPADFRRDLQERLEPFLESVYRPLAPLSAARPPRIVPTPSSGETNPHSPAARFDSGSRNVEPAGDLRRVTESGSRPRVPPGIPQLAPAPKAHPRTSEAVANLKAPTIGKKPMPRKRGPPGIPAISFPANTSASHPALAAPSTSVAEVERTVGGKPSSLAAAAGIASGGPRSISEGLATAPTVSRGSASRAVPYVLIESTIADRLKRRRNKDDYAESKGSGIAEENAKRANGGPPRRSDRAAKRRRIR